jgi:PPM family protein phosphatase
MIPQLAIDMAVRSERGQRDSNEDDLCNGQAGFGWYAVLSDGAGGHERGAEASRHVVTCLGAMFGGLRETSDFSPENLTRAVRATHALLQREQLGAQGRRRMHATVVLLCIDASATRLLWSNVGDSRLYRVRDGVPHLLSRDDSVVQQLVDGGLLTPEQARGHPMKNQLVSALGIDDAVDPHTSLDALAVQPGDAFLLCSDGWWQCIDEAQMCTSLAHADTPAQWLDTMQHQIDQLADPKQDNFSAIAVWAGRRAEPAFDMDDDSTLPRRRRM